MLSQIARIISKFWIKHIHVVQSYQEIMIVEYFG